MKNTEGVLSNSIVLSEIDFAHFLKTTSFTILLFTYFIRLYVMKKLLNFSLLCSIILFLNSCIADRISSSGNFSFAGTAKNMNAKISGSGNIRAYELPCEVATVKISGSGDMQLNVSRQLDATIISNGDIVYKGIPSVNARVTGNGRVVKF